MSPEPRRGEVWYADVPGDKRRPVLVLTRDPLGRYLHSVICVPVTSTVRGLSTEVALGPRSGLVAGSVVNCDNTFLLARARLVRRLGAATGSELDEVCHALGIALGCS